MSLEVGQPDTHLGNTIGDLGNRVIDDIAVLAEGVNALVPDSEAVFPSSAHESTRQQATRLLKIFVLGGVNSAAMIAILLATHGNGNTTEPILNALHSVTSLSGIETAQNTMISIVLSHPTLIALGVGLGKLEELGAKGARSIQRRLSPPSAS